MTGAKDCKQYETVFIRRQFYRLEANKGIATKVARTLLGAPGIATSNKKLLVTSALLLVARSFLGNRFTCSNKNATRNGLSGKGHFWFGLLGLL